MTPWKPDDKGISILLDCGLDFSSWKGEAGQDEAIEEILERTGIDYDLLYELREWWFFSANPYLEAVEESLLSFVEERGDGEDVAESVSEQFGNDVFCSDLLIMIGNRFFHSDKGGEGVPGCEVEPNFGHFIDVNDVEEDDIADLLRDYFETDAVDKVSKEFFESPRGLDLLGKIPPG